MKEQYVIAFDSICEGMQCQMTTDAQGNNGVPTLYNSEYEALIEIFDDNWSRLDGADDWPELKEELGWVKSSCYGRAKTIIERNYPIKKLRAWIEDFNYYDLSPVKKSEFLMGRKTIVGMKDGELTGQIIGKKI